MLFDEAAQVQHAPLGELLLHLVEFVGADGVQVAPGQLLLENDGVGHVVEETGRALEVVEQQGLVAQVVQAALVLESV